MKSVTREKLEERARELGCFPDPENHCDKALLDAIKAEQAAAQWLEKFEALPTDEARRNAAHRLGMEFWPDPTIPAGVDPDGPPR